MTKLTLGTAKIIRNRAGQIVLTYMTEGSFLVGERFYGNVVDAIGFCKNRGLRIIEINT